MQEHRTPRQIVRDVERESAENKRALHKAAAALAAVPEAIRTFETKMLLDMLRRAS